MICESIQGRSKAKTHRRWAEGHSKQIEIQRYSPEKTDMEFDFLYFFIPWESRINNT